MANSELDFIPENIATAISQACSEVSEGKLDSQFPTSSLQGGAGTSTNMNVNEVLANRALEMLGKEKGDYKTIHPLETVNLHQSTNDIYPTALKVTAIEQLRLLSENCAVLQQSLQKQRTGICADCKSGNDRTSGGRSADFGRRIRRILPIRLPATVGVRLKVKNVCV